MQSVNNGVWTITGGGTDIWGANDQFYAVTQPVTGDGTLSAHLTSQTNTDPYAKAGPMFRLGTAANAPYYFAALTPSHGVLIQYRTVAGAAAQEAVGVAGVTPLYLRIARTGTTFSTYTSTDGTNWTLLNGSTMTIVALNGTLQRGLAVSAHNNATTSTATFDTVVNG